MARVETERADYNSLDERAAALDERAHRSAALAGACADWDNARAALAQAHRALADALTEQGLGADSWRTLLLPLPQVEALEARVAAHEKALFAARKKLLLPEKSPKPIKCCSLLLKAALIPRR